jgi:GT2 family glycosyltransferase
VATLGTEHLLEIIIVAHNSGNIIGQCLSNICPHFPVTVVDNASTDTTIELAKNAGAHVISLEENEGYGRAANAGLNASKAPYTLLLNPDIIASKESITALLEHTQKHPKAAITSPLLYRTKKGKQVLNMRGDIDLTQDICHVDYIVGAAMLFTMDNLKKSGFFDPDIFLYYEDDAICYHARQSGFDVFVCTEVSFTHLVGKSSPSTMAYEKLKSWHFAWSYLHWMEVQHGRKKTTHTAYHCIFRYIIKIIGNLFTFRWKEAIKNYCKIRGSAHYLKGRSAFKKSGKAWLLP